MHAPPRRPPDKSRAPARFAALDGWRGVSAVLVALYHWRGSLGYQVNSHFAQLGLIRNAYLFVDFFFVLSGFVIAARYQDLLRNRAFRFSDFVALRIGRLWPLQIATLLLTVVIVKGLILQPHDWITFTIPPADISLRSFVLNVFLLQGMHTTPMLTWNHPSWSISAEFFTYIAFALLWIGLRRWTAIASVVIIAAMPVVILKVRGDMDATHDWGFARAMLGFAIGVLVFNAMRSGRAQEVAARLRAGVATAVETAFVLATGAFVWIAGVSPWSIAAPFVFGITIAAFSLQRGRVSTLLLTAPSQLLGRLSYSIYLLQFPLQQLLMFIALYLGATRWIDPNSLFSWPAGVTGRPVLGATSFGGDISNLVMLTVLIAAAALSYRWVEATARKRVRDWVVRKA